MSGFLSRAPRLYGAQANAIAGEYRREEMARRAQNMARRDANAAAARAFVPRFKPGDIIVADRVTVSRCLPYGGRYGGRSGYTLDRVAGPLRCRVIGKHDGFPGYSVEILEGYELPAGYVVCDVYVAPSAARAAEGERAA